MTYQYHRTKREVGAGIERPQCWDQHEKGITATGDQNYGVFMRRVWALAPAKRTVAATTVRQNLSMIVERDVAR